MKSDRQFNSESYRELLENINDWFWELDANGSYTYSNKVVQKLLGYSPEEIIGKSPVDLCQPSSKQKLLTTFEKYVQNQISFKHFEIPTLHKNGTIIYCEANGQPVFNSQGTFQGFCGIARDISRRKQIETALSYSEERHGLFYNPSFGGSIIHDKGSILDCSQGITTLTGYTYDEIIGMDGLQLIAPDWRDFVMEKIRSGYEAAYEAEGLKKDNTVFHVRIHGKNIQYHGKAARIAEFRDITEIKKREAELRSANEFINQVIDLSIFGMWVSDTEGNIIQVNQSLCKILNISEDQIVGQYNVLRDENLIKQGLIPQIKMVFEEYQPTRFKIHWQAEQSGAGSMNTARDLYVDVYMFPIRDENGDLKNVVCQFLDIA